MKPKKIPERSMRRDHVFTWDTALFYSTAFWRKFRNTFLQPSCLWPLVVKDEDVEALLSGDHRTKGARHYFNKALARFLWFWPRLVDAEVWVNEKNDPSPFRELTEDSAFLVDTVVEHSLVKDAGILDIGCNCGRHLAALADHGFSNLHGVDISSEAIRVMPEWFPQLDDKCDAKRGLIQGYLSKTPDGAFDIVFTRGATVELIHPSFPLVPELCRVARSYVILMIRENEHAYPRFWTYEFARRGFLLTQLVRPVQQMMTDKAFGKGVSLLVFRRKPNNAE